MSTDPSPIAAHHTTAGTQFAPIGKSHYPLIVALFCGLLVLSNIGAVKLIAFGPIIADGGALLFPLTYILGDVLSEIYGWKAARNAILIGFGLSVLAALTFWLIQLAPPAADWEHQEAFEAVLGFVPRIVLASIAGYLVGQLLNAYVLVKLKEITQGKRLWVRLLGSTAVGELFDTIVFCTIAFYGVITGQEFFIYVATGYIYKVAVEVVLLPVTYRVIAFVKKREPGYGTSVVEP